jgi:hypothetical protein
MTCSWCGQFCEWPIECRYCGCGYGSCCSSPATHECIAEPDDDYILDEQAE